MSNINDESNKKKLGRTKLANMVLHLASITDFEEDNFMAKLDYDLRIAY